MQVSDLATWISWSFRAELQGNIKKLHGTIRWETFEMAKPFQFHDLMFWYSFVLLVLVILLGCLIE